MRPHASLRDSDQQQAFSLSAAHLGDFRLPN